MISHWMKHCHFCLAGLSFVVPAKDLPSEGSLAGARDRSARDRDNTLYANQTLKTYGATGL